MKRPSGERSAPLIGPYTTHYNAFAKLYKRNIPFIFFIQIGKFLEAYNDSAKIVSEQLSMKLTKKAGNDWTGFPISSGDTHTKTLAEKGYAVIKMIQTENEETKKQRTGEGNSKKANRVVLPGETICMVCDKPLAIVQGTSVLFYFGDTNTYKEFSLENVDQLICKLMQYEPCELIISSMATFIKSIRHLFPQCYIRQYFELGFTPMNTLQKYLSILCQTDKVKTLQEKYSENIPTVRLDARTTLNLTLFDTKQSLIELIAKNMSSAGKTYLRNMLYNPLACEESIKDRQDRVKELMDNDFIDTLVQNKPKKNTLATNRHPLFKTKVEQFVTTESNVKKFSDIIIKASLEIELWKKWMATLQTSGVAVLISFPYTPTPDEIQMETQSDEELLNELRTFNDNHIFEARIVSSGIWKHLFETDIENENLVRKDTRLKVQSKTQKVIRFDSPEIQSARLACAENATRKVMESAEQMKDWIKHFQSNFTPEFFEQFSHMECYVCLAHYFKYCQQNLCWPMVTNEVIVKGMEIPLGMTHIKNWVKNDFNDNFMILKGSNGSGKTSYIRTLAINLLLAHCGFPVFAEQFQFKILDALYMRLGSSDCLAEGKSSFSVEMEHMNDIAKSMTTNSAVFIDELGCSCDTASGKKICQYFIDKILKTGSLCIFSTHFDIEQEVTKEMGMDIESSYTFKIQNFGKNQSNKNAIRVAERCGFPSTVLYFAERLLL